MASLFSCLLILEALRWTSMLIRLWRIDLKNSNWGRMWVKNIKICALYFWFSELSSPTCHYLTQFGNLLGAPEVISGPFLCWFTLLAVQLLLTSLCKILEMRIRRKWALSERVEFRIWLGQYLSRRGGPCCRRRLQVSTSFSLYFYSWRIEVETWPWTSSGRI